MAWEVWFDESNDVMGFFCNTYDVSFGPIFYVDSDFDKELFYKLWASAGFLSPRIDSDNIFSNTKHLLSLMGWKANIQASIRVFNHGKMIYEGSNKECYDNLSFSPFEKELEAQSEEDFDMICGLIEDCENDMRHLILTEPNKTETFMESIYKSEKLGHDYNIRVEMKWEVLDE